jgi:hypothetical protein
MKKSNKNNLNYKWKEIKNALKSEKFDPNGSYTGVPSDGKTPIQDQDDL